MKKIFVMFVRNSVLNNIVLILILVSGGMAVLFMQRELFPDFSMNEVLIEVPYLGAAPSEVEEGVILKIEEALNGMDGISEYSTRSEENLGSVEIKIKHGRRVSDVINRIRSKIGAISTFPEDAEKPMITEVMHRTDVMKIYLSGEVSEEILKETAYRIKDELLMLKGVSLIELFGVRDYEISVEVSEERLKAFGLSFDDVAESIAQNNLNLSCGVIRTHDRDVRIRALGRKYTGLDLASVPVITGADGSIVTLDRLADIRDEFSDDIKMARVNGAPAVILEIYKTNREDALAISAAVNDFVKNKQTGLPDNLKFGILYDLTGDLRSRIDLMIKNGAMGLCLVLMLLGIFLEFRLSIWVSIGIPVSILGALVAIWALGGTINMLSLFGLITVLGIVVDDAIVVGEAVFYHYQNELPPLEAVLAGIQEVGAPVVASILTTILAFLPLAFIGDVIGRFLLILPMAVIPCLIVSLFECFFLLPAHLVHGMKNKRHDKHVHQKLRILNTISTFQNWARCGLDHFAQQIYPFFLEKALRYRYVMCCASICLFALCLGLLGSGLIKFKALPEAETALVSASIKLTPGSSVNLTQRAVSRIEDALLTLFKDDENNKRKYIINRMAVIGATVSQEADDSENGRHCGGVLALLDADSFSDVSINGFLLLWEDAVGVIPGVDSIVFEGRSEGPPGDPIEVRLQGRDSAMLKNASLELISEFRKINGVHQIRSDMVSRVDELHVRLKPNVRIPGLTQYELAAQVRAAFHGREAVRVQRNQDDVCIKVRYTKSEREKATAMETLRIRTGEGYEIPFTSVADVAYSRGFDVINRVNGMRCMSVNAAVDSNKVSPKEIIDDLSGGLLVELSKKYPGLNISFEGEEKHMHDALNGLFFGFPLAILGIWIITAAMFQSYSQPFIILFTTPFGIIGGIIGHFVMGYDLSLMSIIGLAALSGIVVNDAIILLECINENLLLGMEFFNAVIQAGRRRFRAIFLTTISTVGGLAPLVLERSLQAGFLIPMAISISAGLVCATALTLVIIPCIFCILNDLRLIRHRVWTGVWERREALEPFNRRCCGLSAHVGVAGDRDSGLNLDT